MGAGVHIDAATVRDALAHVPAAQLAGELGIGPPIYRAHGPHVRGPCPIHGGDARSWVLSDGGQWCCHSRACHEGHGGDALGLVAAMHQLDTRRDFRRVLELAADIAGVDADTPRPPPRPRPTTPPPNYPPRDEVAAVWDAAVPVTRDGAAMLLLRERRVDVVEAERRDLARVLWWSAELPSWARCGGRTWIESCHRLIVPTYDAAGDMRSLRAWRVVNTYADTPKRLPPVGYSYRGTVMADPAARAMLVAGPDGPAIKIVIAEGEPDHFSAALRWPTIAVVGVVSGSWTAAIAARVPHGSRVSIWTDRDPAGHRYADAIDGTLAHCDVGRWK